MKGFASRTVIAVAAMVAMAAPMASAQTSIGASNVTLKKQYVKSVSTGLSPTTTLTPAFTPTEISCPSNGDCMVLVNLSAILGTVLEGQAVYARVLIDGLRAMPSIYDDVPLIDTWVNASEYRTSRSFTWLKEVTPGTHIVTVEFYATASTGIVMGRTLSISVLK